MLLQEMFKSIYCTRARSCENKPGYLENAKGSLSFSDLYFTVFQDTGICQSWIAVYLMCCEFLWSSWKYIKARLTNPAVCSRAPSAYQCLYIGEALPNWCISTSLTLVPRCLYITLVIIVNANWRIHQIAVNHRSMAGVLASAFWVTSHRLHSALHSSTPCISNCSSFETPPSTLALPDFHYQTPSSLTC